MAKKEFCRGLICGVCAAVSALAPSFISAQGEYSIEYFIDVDKGVGMNTIATATKPETSLEISLAEVHPGVHTISFRTADEFGNWSTTITHPLYVGEANRFAALEYFIDSDPGEGKANAIAQLGGNVIDLRIVTSMLSTGGHTFNVRGLNSNGSWTNLTTCPFIVLADTLILEWWYDEDPGVGKANQLNAESGENIFLLPTADISSGVHILSFRCKDRNGNWSVTSTLPLYVTEPTSSFKAAEYFIDDDPGEGFGTPVTLSQNKETAFTVPTDDLSVGNHTFCFRCLLENDEWMPVYASPFEVNELGGIKKLNFDNQFLISRNGDNVVVTTLEPNGECFVEVYSISGLKIYSSSWDDFTSTHLINVPNEDGPIIVKVKDSEGKIYVKKL